jgi:phosphoribosylformimino-5-aminoimidazole carboxamide ribotide isomerase
MEVIPAIDLLDGHVVRLAQGAFDAVTDYDDDPVEVARRWRDEGATRIHVVDLDAARQGRPSQRQVIERLVAAVDVRCQVAGGIRSEADVDATLAAGADRVVLGSALISDPDLACHLVERYGPERVVAALDVRDGQALGDGWVPGARGTGVLDLATDLEAAGIHWFAVTAVARDGVLSGPDLDLLGSVHGVIGDASIIASGGIGSLHDIRTLARRGYAAAIVGRALYAGVFSLPEAIGAAGT